MSTLHSESKKIWWPLSCRVTINEEPRHRLLGQGEGAPDRILVVTVSDSKSFRSSLAEGWSSARVGNLSRRYSLFQSRLCCHVIETRRSRYIEVAAWSRADLPLRPRGSRRGYEFRSLLCCSYAAEEKSLASTIIPYNLISQYLNNSILLIQQWSALRENLYIMVLCTYIMHHEGAELDEEPGARSRSRSRRPYVPVHNTDIIR